MNARTRKIMPIVLSIERLLRATKDIRVIRANVAPSKFRVAQINNCSIVRIEQSFIVTNLHTLVVTRLCIPNNRLKEIRKFLLQTYKRLRIVVIEKLKIGEVGGIRNAITKGLLIGEGDITKHSMLTERRFITD